VKLLIEIRDFELMLNGQLLFCTSFIASILFTVSCSNTEYDSSRPIEKYNPSLKFAMIHEELFGKKLIFPDEDSLYALTDSQISDFLKFMDSDVTMRKNDRLALYLASKESKLRYTADTHKASIVMDKLEGNCMSLAILTSALAKAAGIHVTYELVDANPVFEFSDGLALKAVHVRAVLWDTKITKKKSTINFSKRYVKIDFFPTGTEKLLEGISADNFIARFYLNHTADAISVQNTHEAYWLIRAALDIDPENQDALISLAVVYNRVNQVRTAKQIYEHVTNLDPNNLTALKNYSKLLEREGDLDDLAIINAKIAKLGDPSPERWLSNGRRFFVQKDYANALSNYKKATIKAPYSDKAQLGLAQSYLALGKLTQAKRALEKALELSSRDSRRLIYKSKLIALTTGASS
jgi:Flp pilus assembly protein TadD